ncbi:MAG: alpha-ketoglutarate-dependent dioxygenase AlkB [Paenibacillus sp.]|nr:alpha-ketoglutarate-dependent dioxygenase AlkB [Paenibacillus sp.]
MFRFEDGILIVSLLSSCVMTLKEIATGTIIDILLNPGDILSLSGESRYQWEHGIKEQLFDTIDDQLIERGTRISVTLRKLKPGSTEIAATSTSSRY